MTRRDRRQGRVVESRRIVLAAFRLGGAFGLVSLGWSQDGPAPLPRSEARVGCLVGLLVFPGK